MPVLIDLKLRALEQPVVKSRRMPRVPGIGDDTGAHFSKEYMTQVVKEVQQALTAAGADTAACCAAKLLKEAETAQPAARCAATLLRESEAAQPAARCAVTLLRESGTAQLAVPMAQDSAVGKASETSASSTVNITASKHAAS